MAILKSFSSEVGDDLPRLLDLMWMLKKAPLREWDRDFIEDLSDSLRIWRENTFMSKRQYVQLERIEDEYL